MKLIEQLLSLLLRPFSQGVWYLFSLWVLSSAASVYYWLYEGELLNALYIGIGGWCSSYFCCVLVFAFRGRIRGILAAILYVVGVINICVDKAVYNICHLPFHNDTVAIILGTNASESSEFIHVFVNYKIVLFVVCAILCTVFLYAFRNKLQGLINNRLSFFLSAITILILFAPFLVKNSDGREMPSWNSVFLNKTVLFLQYEKPVDLIAYRKTLVLNTLQTQPPRSVIVAIGESTSRSHSSLYGYDKGTASYCLSLGKADSLIVFSNVTSAYYNTVPAMRMMLSTSAEAGDKDYMCRTTVFDLMKARGFETAWVSNQSAAGIFDSPTATYGRLADSLVWVGRQGMGQQKDDYDSLVIAPVKSILETDKPVFCFAHLMGCHEWFWRRYPPEFALFSASDYTSYPEHQRQTLAEYDNAVLYDDFIVSRLFGLIKDTDAVGIFVPDHGLDVYESDSNYCGHARAGDTKSIEYAERIPFLVYCPTKFRELHPDTFSWLQSIKDEPLNTKDLIDFLSRLCGITYFER